MKNYIFALNSIPMLWVSGLFLLASFILEYILPIMGVDFTFAFNPAWVSLFISGIPLAYLAIRNTLQGRITSPLLITIAMCAAVYKGNAKEFKGFLHQLRARAPGKTLAIILDNSSIHHAKYIKQFLNKYPSVKLFFLPPYSPEYNPVEQIWRWSKAQVCAGPPVEKGIGELLGRFRKFHHARTHGRLAKPFDVGIGVWHCIYQ